MSILQILVIALFMATLIYAAMTDFKRLEISNMASLFITLLFIPAAVMAELSFTNIMLHYAWAFGILVVGAIIFALGLIGGGDVKLLAGVAVWFEAGDLVDLVMYIALLGGALAVIMLSAKKIPFIARLLGTPVWLESNHGLQQPIPYGVAISAASIMLIGRVPVLPEYLHQLLNG
jgi:prepilin peptidase CpaA